MATSISKFRLQVILDSLFINSDDFNNNATQQKISNKNLIDDTLSDGTGNNQIKTLFRDQRTVAGGANDDIDLAGALVNAFGSTINLTKLKMLFIENLSTTASDLLVVGAAGTNPLSTLFSDTSDKMKIGPEGFLLVYNPRDGYVVTAGSADVLRIANPGGTAIIYNIYIAGTV